MSDSGEIAEGEELAVGAPDPADQAPALHSRENVRSVRVKAPTRGNRKLEKFLDAVNRERLVRKLRKRIEAMPTRSKRSRYSAAISENAWRLLMGDTNPEQLASELGVSARALRREWARYKDRLLKDEHISALLNELRDSA